MINIPFFNTGGKGQRHRTNIIQKSQQMPPLAVWQIFFLFPNPMCSLPRSQQAYSAVFLYKNSALSIKLRQLGNIELL